MFRKDNYRLGFGLGLLAPVLGMLLYYLLKFFPTFSIKDFFSVLSAQPTLISGIVSLSLFVNAVLLTLYLNKRKDKSAIGIFVSTCIYGILALIIKFML